MPKQPSRTPDAGWTAQHLRWRDPLQICAGSEAARRPDAALLRHRVEGCWWEVLERLRLTLVISREYEHFLLACSVQEGRPLMTFLACPHPSGLCFDADREILHVASTRNPNQVMELVPTRADGERRLGGGPGLDFTAFAPARSATYPGCLYLHDLALLGGRLYGSAAGLNAIIALSDPRPGHGGYAPAWWPKCAEAGGRLCSDRNYLQLNSLTTASNPEAAFFTASTDRRSHRRPGHRNFPVDGRGVIFSGRTREPLVRGLTRPHSVREQDGRIWVDNSGYGELGLCAEGRFQPQFRLPGWTRGLCLCGDVAFVGTSRVIPRFRCYAPGLDVQRSICGVHAVNLRSGAVLGSITWPAGNQIFAIEAVPARVSLGLPFLVGRASTLRERSFFHAFSRTATTRTGT